MNTGPIELIGVAPATIRDMLMPRSDVSPSAFHQR